MLSTRPDLVGPVIARDLEEHQSRTPAGQDAGNQGASSFAAAASMSAGPGFFPLRSVIRCINT